MALRIRFQLVETKALNLCSEQLKPHVTTFKITNFKKLGRGARPILFVRNLMNYKRQRDEVLYSKQLEQPTRTKSDEKGIGRKTKPEET